VAIKKGSVQMKAICFVRQTCFKVLGSAAVAALFCRCSLAQSNGQNQLSLPNPPNGPAVVAPIAQQPPIPIQATPSPDATGTPNNNAAMRALMLDVIKEHEEEKKREEELKKKVAEDQKAAEGSVVQVNTPLNAFWDNGGLRFKSADGAFDFHIGGRLMYDYNWFGQSTGLLKSTTQNAAQAKISGLGPGIGDLEDGSFVRRARFVSDGTMYETMEWKVEFDVENYDDITFDEMYVGAKHIPFFDTIRVGQEHVPFGLEAYSSSRWLETMERSPLFDAFYQEFAPGIFWNKDWLDSRITTQAMFGRNDSFNQNGGDSFGDGRYEYTARISFLPIYEDNGRELLHLALDYQWRKGSDAADLNFGTTTVPAPAAITTDDNDLFRFRARMSLRDAVGQSPISQGDSARVVDTGNIIASHANSLNPELLTYWGPFWIQSEFEWTHLDNVVYPVPNGTTILPAEAARVPGGASFYGAYIMCGYFLTGDNRGYDMRMGKLDRNVPLENFFLVKGDDGRIHCGLGAWEVVYRYAYLNLDSGPIVGGMYGEHTFGLNWYWSPNIKWQFNYVIGDRMIPASAAATGINGGLVQGIGTRVALEF
jgi:phosphate-selective porin OprO/OprP